VTRRIRVLLSTCPQEAADRIARQLIEQRLAACVNVVPGVRSIYRWEGEIQDAAESLLILKTREDLVPALEKALLEIHPYDTPELLSLPVEHGAERYLDWIADVTEPPQNTPQDTSEA
jgi:periplasmic divalent cation tolerance protein